MRKFLIGVAVCAASRAWAQTTIGFDGVSTPTAGVFGFSYQEAGYTVTSMATPFQNDAPGDYGNAWVVEDSHLRAKTPYFPAETTFNLTHGGDAFNFLSLDAKVGTQDTCFVPQPPVGDTLMISGFFGGVQQFSHISNVRSCKSYNTFANAFAGTTIDRLSVSLANLRLTYVDSLVVTAVPEPETWALMLGGIGVLGWVNRRRGQWPRSTSTGPSARSS